MPVLGDAGVVSSILNCILKLTSATPNADICSRCVLRAAELDPRGHKRAVDAHRLLCLAVAMCIYTLRQKGIRREYCGVRGANVEEVGATDIEETKLQTPVLRIYEASVVPCPQLRPTIVACSTRNVLDIASYTYY